MQMRSGFCRPTGGPRTLRQARERENHHETCRRHRHGDCLIHRQQHPGSAGIAARREVRDYAPPRITSNTVSAARCMARRSSTRSRCWTGARRASWPRARAWNYIAMQQAIQDSGLEASDIVNPRTGIIMGSGGPSTRTIFDAAVTTQERGPKRIGPTRRAEGDELHRIGGAGDVVRDQGRQLFDLFGLRDIQPLHRQRLRDDPGRQAGHCLRRRIGRSRLDDVEPFRRHGRDVLEVQRPAGSRLARL